jgi:hypothetical protein
MRRFVFFLSYFDSRRGGYRLELRVSEKLRATEGLLDEITSHAKSFFPGLTNLGGSCGVSEALSMSNFQCQ